MVRKDLGCSGAVFPFWTPPLRPRGAYGGHLGTSVSPFSSPFLFPPSPKPESSGEEDAQLVPSTSPKPHSGGGHPEMKE